MPAKPSAPIRPLSAVKPPPASTPAQELLYSDYAELSQKTAKRPLVLFFGRPTFADNTKYLFLATRRAAIGCEVVWCGTSKPLLAQLGAQGFACHDMTGEPRKTCNLFLHASVAVFCENPAAALGLNSAFSGCLAGAQKIQLWHGVSVKQLDLMLIPHLDIRDTYFRGQLRFATRVDHFLSTAPALDAFWIRAFGCTSLVRAGQPRNEVLVRDATAEEMLGAELPPAQADLLRSAKRKLLVVPTWQRGGKLLHISTPAFHAQLARWATANDGVVFVKSHPFLRAAELPKDIPGKVFFLGAGTDVYPWMAKFDALITDYSSIMFDYLLTHKPIFAFNSRTQASYGFEPDYSLIPEGNFRYEFEADNFEDVIAKNLGDHPLHASQKKLGAQLFETPPLEAGAQLVQFISDCSRCTVDKDITLTSPIKSTPLRAAS
jgi:CDP-glycerol glycerophosphotransferase